MRKVTEKNQELFVKRVTAYLLKLGATQLDDSVSFHRFQLDSIVGKLTINLPFADDHVYTYTVYSRFEDVDKAKNVFNCNQYSGKFNIHQSIMPMKNIIDNIKWHFGATQKIKETI